jgi:tRNA A-37 threonylcarbamoyl transferase component Bud32
MAKHQTILVLDRDAATTLKILGGEQAILVPTISVSQFHYFIERSACDVWLCDLASPGLDFPTDLKRVLDRNPETRVILTGVSSYAAIAAGLIKQGSATSFIPKPWRLMSLRQLILRGASDEDDAAEKENAAPAPQPIVEAAKPATRRFKPQPMPKTTAVPRMPLSNTQNLSPISRTQTIPPISSTQSIPPISAAGRKFAMPPPKHQGSLAVRPSTPSSTPPSMPSPSRITSTTTRSAQPSHASAAALANALARSKPKVPSYPTGRIPEVDVPRPVRPSGPLKIHSAAPSRTHDDTRYHLHEMLGEGGMGKVYRAYDVLLDMEVAIKVMRPDFFNDDSILQTLKSEARICMQLTHPHIVRLYDVGQRDGNIFLVMEFVSGHTLYDVMRNPDSRSIDYVRTVAKAIGSALSYAHEHGVVHNDLTPGNVIIGSGGILKLIDFGIAGAANQTRAKSEFVLGTPSYMSPEQLRCEPAIAPTTDIFALGVLLCQMLTGLLPQTENATPAELAHQPRPPVTNVHPAMCAVLDRALAFDPAHRWQTAGEFVEAFDQALSA